jgi:hypothetical protein
MIGACAAAGLFALSRLLYGLATALLSGEDPGATARNLATAGGWLRFVGFFVALVAICNVGWKLVVQRDWAHVWQVGAAVVSTLLLAVGSLAIEPVSNAADAGNVIVALGLGGWAVLLFVVAGLYSIAKHRSVPRLQPQAALWLGAAGGVLVLAISVGLPDRGSNQGPLGTVPGFLGALGFAGLAITLTVARSQGKLNAASLPLAIGGLWVAALASLASGVAAATMFSSTSLMPLRVGLSLPSFVGVVGYVALGLAACRQLQALQLPPRATATGLDDLR